MIHFSDLVKLAYQVKQRLQDKGYRVGVMLTYTQVSIAATVSGKIMEIKITEDLALKGAEFISDGIEKAIIRVN